MARTVRGVVADTVAALIAGGMMANDPAVIVRACSVLGLNRVDLDEAAARLTSGDGLSSVPFSAVVTPRPPAQPAWRPAAGDPPAAEPTRLPAPTPKKQAPTRLRPERIVQGERLLLCTGPCGEWLPTDRFVPRTDRPGFFTSRCIPCRQRYQRTRQVTVATLDALNQANIRFVLSDESNLVGLACTVCGRQFKPGDVTLGATTLTHEHCSP